MELAPASALLLLSAASSCALGAMVILRNRHKRTHQAFAALTLDLMLWALGVLVIIHTHDREKAEFWLRATFCVAAFLPATYYTFISVFPHQRFQGSPAVFWLLWGTAVVVVLGTFTDFYLREVEVFANRPPRVSYGPVFYLYGASAAVSMLFSFLNLMRKLRSLSGVERRQVQYVIFGVFLANTLAVATNILAPILHIDYLEAYGPNFMVLMALIFAYAMVRYHLLDMWVLFSRTTVYVTLTVTVALIFVGSVSLVGLVSSDDDGRMSFWSTALAAVVISLVLQPLKEHLQLFLDRTILKRRYDMNRLLARISQYAAERVRINELLDAVGKDIRDTVGVHIIRVLLVDEKDPTVLNLEYSSLPGEAGRKWYNHGALVNYMRQKSEPLILEKLLYGRSSPQRTLIAGHLAELDAYLCVPLKTSSEIVGLLTLGQKTSRDIYSIDDLVVFTAMAGPLGSAIQNARLYRRLEEANLHRARILTHMRGAVVAVDTDGYVSTVNHAAKELLGPVETGQHYRSLPPELARILDMTLREQRAITDCEMQLDRADGEQFCIVVSSSRLHTASGDIVGAMLMIYDLTALKRLEQSVQRADRLSSLGTLAAGMAHEIKNPLVSIKTFTQLLLSRFDDPDFRATFSEIVPHEVERIDSIVMRLLDFARPQAPCFASHNLRVIVDEVLALLENEMRKNCISVERDFPEDYVEVYGDEQQLHQVFLNLFLNAIDALKDTEGGVLRVGAEYRRMPRRQGTGYPYEEAEFVRIVVADSGCGMPADAIERIFTPFYTTKPHGSGLGLAVVHGIVTEHNGEIDVTSTPGEGTTFILSLPLVRSASAVEET
jgi:PAS domain S-box-containing protein